MKKGKLFLLLAPILLASLSANVYKKNNSDIDLESIKNRAYAMCSSDLETRIGNCVTLETYPCLDPMRPGLDQYICDWTGDYNDYCDYNDETDC